MTDLKLVLFDCDGTLADSHGFLTHMVESAFRHVGAELPPPELMREFYSLHFNEFFRRCDGHMSAEQIVAASEYMHSKLRTERETGAVTEPFYKGIHTALDALKADGYLMGIVTNKGGHGLKLVLASNQATDYFATLHHSDNSMTKPSPDMVLNALEATGVDPEKCVVVGDSVIDISTANNARVRSIGVTWAGRDAASLREAGAVNVIADVAELVPAIRAVL